MKSFLLILFSCGLLAPMNPEVAIPTEEISETEALAFTVYQAEISRRAGDPQAVAAQPLLVAQSLEAVSNQPLLEQSWGTLTWNSELGNVEIWLENEPLILSYYTDENGRPAFAGENLQGVIDVSGQNVYIEINASVGEYTWFGDLITSTDESGQPQTSLNFTTSRQCVCKGSANRCPRIDCTQANVCSYSNASGNHNSFCKFFIMPDSQATVVPEEP